MKKLKVKELTKRYGEKKALDSFSANFVMGVNAILGPNGAGKSTLIGLITDTITRDEGRIEYGGEDVLEHSGQFRAVIGFMPQTQCLYEQMTPTEFLLYMSEMKGIPRDKAKQQIPELLSVVNLSGTSHRAIKTFSGGMRQRVLLAQSMLGDPEVLILDEPTAGLDPEERVRLREYISDLGRNKIVLITTHIASDVEHIADRVLIIKEGRLLFIGSNDELFKATGNKSIEDAYITMMHKDEPLCRN